VEERLAGVAARMGFENFAAELAQVFKPCAEVFWKLCVNLAAETLRECGAFAAGGDGDLKVAAVDYRTKKEIAVGNVVDTVAGDVSGDTAFVNGSVYFWNICGCDDYELAVEVGVLKLALDPLELSVLRQLMDFGKGVGGDYVKAEAGGEQGADLVERYVACSDEEAVAVGEIQEDRQEGHGVARMLSANSSHRGESYY